MEYKIISAAQADWQKFKEIRLGALETDERAYGASFAEQSQKADERWQEGLARTEKPLFFVQLGNDYIGMAGSKPIGGSVYMLIAVYLKPEYRGRGIAEELIKTIEKDLCLKGITQLDLMVNKEQIAAVKFYQKLGYAITKEVKGQKMGDGKKYDEYYMSKILR